MKQLKFIILFLFLFFQASASFAQENPKKISLLLFWGNGCSHCEKEKKFLTSLQAKHTFLEIKQYEVWENKDNKILLEEISKNLNIKTTYLPITIIENKYYIIGFQDENTTGKEIEKIVLQAFSEKPLIKAHSNALPSIPEAITVPFFGKIKIKNLSLPLLTLILGAIDGFNPCAMWVLLMLLSFLIATHNRKKNDSSWQHFYCHFGFGLLYVYGCLA